MTGENRIDSDAVAHLQSLNFTANFFDDAETAKVRKIAATSMQSDWIKRAESEAKADDVKDRIDAVEGVSEALFDEWEDELEQYTSASLRRDSERKMVQTRRQYDQLIKAMRRAESKIAPVLRAFRDQVLYLKHNLNAQAIASLQSELVGVKSDIADLIQEMEKSIGEANSFINTMLEE